MHTARRRARRLALPLAGSLIAVAGLPSVASAATAAGASVRLESPVVSPGLGSTGTYRFSVDVPGADRPADGFRDGPKVGFCIEYTQGAGSTSGTTTIRTGAEGADLSLANDDSANVAATASGRDRVEWLLLSSRRALGTATGDAERAREAAAHQKAIWHLTNPTTGGTSPISGDPAANTRALALLAASATHGSAVDRRPSIVVLGGEPCGQSTRTLAVAGAPFTSVALTIASGDARFTSGELGSQARSSRVELGADGTAEVTLEGAEASTVAISGTFVEATLVQADNGRRQDFVYVELGQLVAGAQTTFRPCQVTPPDPDEPQPPGDPSTPTDTPDPTPGTPTDTPDPTPSTPAETPGSPPAPSPPDQGVTEPAAGESPQSPAPAPAPREETQAPRRARLVLTKRGPRRALAGQRVAYRVRVVNRGRVAARAVRLTDVLPRGMSLARRARGAKLRGGRLTVRVGTLAPGRARTLRVVLRVDRVLSGRRCNVAIARSANAHRVVARACTRVVPLPQAITPAVTG